MSAEITKAIRRLLAVYGTPKTDEPDILFEEFTKALSGFRTDILAKGVDRVIKDRAFSTWPTVGEVVKACRDVCDEMADSQAPVQQDYPKREPVAPEVARALMQGFAKSMDAKNTFNDIKLRYELWHRTHGCKVFIDVSKPWGEEVWDEYGRIVPIGWPKEGKAA